MNILHHAALIAALALSGAVAACTEADRADTEPAAAMQPEDTQSMQLRLTLEETSPGARSSEAADATITDVMLLLFTPDAAGEPDRLYAVLRGENISETDAGGSRTFDARLGISAATPKRLVAVAVANAARFFDAMHSAASQGADFSTVGALLTEDMATRDGIATQYTFYGRATTMIDTSLKAQSVKMQMLRDLARVRLTLTEEVYARGHRLASLHFYNRYDRICLIPLRYAESRATLPGGASAAANSVPGPVLTDSPTLTMVTSEQDMVMGGTGDPDDDYRFTRPALIVGVYYRGTELSYYRLDLRDGEGMLHDILRNHSYNVNVNGIDGPGQPTPEEAYFNVTTGISAEIVEWDDEEFDAAFDGGSWVALAREVTLGPGAGDEASLEFATNVPTEQWELTWAAPDADFSELTYVTAATLRGDLFEVSLPVTLDDAGHAALTFKALENLPADTDVRVRTLYINVTPRLRLAINVSQAQASTDDGDAPWGTDYIFGDL